MSPRVKSKDKSARKSTVIRLRVTEAEAEEFRKRSKEAGCQSLSEYIRKRCIEDIVDKADTVKDNV